MEGSTIMLIFVIILQLVIIGIISYQTYKINHPLKTLSETLDADLKDPQVITNFINVIQDMKSIQHNMMG